MIKKIIVIDDEAAIRNSLKGVLEDEGFRVFLAENGKEGLRSIRENIPDCVLLDIWMPGMDGIQVLEKLKEELPQIPVIIMSGHGTIETAVKATKMGAYDFIEKPISLEKLILLINNAINYHKILNENIYLKKQIEKETDLIINSPKMLKIISHLDALAKSDMTIILYGEEGTGKTFLARYIHSVSEKGKEHFVEFDAALSKDFNSVTEKIHLSIDGTLFIKNFLKLTEEMQNIILKNKDKIRLILSDSELISEAVPNGNISKNFLFSINATSILVPALRERKEDIPNFINYYSEKFSKIYNKKISFSNDALKTLEKYEWHGNIKELKNFVEHIFITFKASVVTHRDLPEYILTNCKLSEIKEMLFQHNLLSEAQKSFEKEFLKVKLIEACGNLKKTAEIIGIEQPLLKEKVKEHNLIDYVKY